VGFELVGPDAELRLEGCVLHATVGLDALRAASAFWGAAAAAAGLLRQPAAPRPQAAAVDFTAASGAGGGVGAVERCVLLLDPARCYAAGGGAAIVFNGSSLAAALADPSVSSAVVVQDTDLGALGPGLQRLLGTPPLARRLVVTGCPGASLDFGGMRGLVAVGRGGELVFAAPLRLTGSPSPAGADAAGAAGEGPAGGSSPLLLGGVRVAEGGQVVLSRVQLEAYGAAAAAAQLPQAAGAAVRQAGVGVVVGANLRVPLGGGWGCAYGGLGLSRRIG
jgi:hypothetical protein